MEIVSGGVCRSHLGIVVVLQKAVFHAEHADVRPERHLPHTVAVEIKLVLLKCCKVLKDCCEVLERLQIDAPAGSWQNFFAVANIAVFQQDIISILLVTNIRASYNNCLCRRLVGCCL